YVSVRSICSLLFSSRRRHTISKRDWSSDVCSSDLNNNNEDQSADVEVNEEGFPIVDEELTMTMIAPGTGSSPNWNELDVLEEYAEKTNINFKYNTPPADDFGTNLNLAFS